MLNKKSKRNLSAPFQPPSVSSSISSSSSSVSSSNNNNNKESQSSLQSPQKQQQSQSQSQQSSESQQQKQSPQKQSQQFQSQQFQQQLERKECPLSLSNRPENRIDYLSYKFDPLESENEITFEKYCGPTPESNWVIPGKLLVGAYPASQDDTETFELLTSILRLGVNQFICLQLEYKANVTEPMWRRGQALRPYYEDVKLLVKNKHKFKILSEESNVCEFEDLDFVHFPIKDCSVTDDSGVFQLALDLVESISRGQVQYLHCWGGHGRTGTLVCIMLHLMYGLNAEEAMNYCQKVHDLRQCPVVVGSPQTQTQRDQVSRIISIAQEQVFKQHHKLQDVCFDIQQSNYLNNHQKQSNHKKKIKYHQKHEPTKFTFNESSQITTNSNFSTPNSTTRIRSDTAEIVNLSICLGGWMIGEKSSSKSPPEIGEISVDTNIQDIELDIIIEDEIESKILSSSCFYLPRITSMNSNNKTPPPSPTNLTPTKLSWFSRKDSPSTSSSSSTSSWKDSLRGLIRRSTSTSDLSSVSSTPPLTPRLELDVKQSDTPTSSE